MRFEDKKQTKKGKLGEAELDKLLFEKLGFIPYIPSPNIDVAHPFDRLCASQDKTQLFIAECKAKARRSYYPDTGINVKSYKQYKFIVEKYHLPLWLFFIDEYEQKIYGNELTKLETETTIIYKGKEIKYPLVQDGIIYFPLSLMIVYAEIDEYSAEKLKDVSERSWDYEI